MRIPYTFLLYIDNIVDAFITHIQICTYKCRCRQSIMWWIQIFSYGYYNNDNCHFSYVFIFAYDVIHIEQMHLKKNHWINAATAIFVCIWLDQ